MMADHQRAGTARICLIGAAIVCLAWPAVAAPKPEDITSLSIEVAALQILHDLELTPEQVSALTRLAKETETPRKSRAQKAVKVSVKYRQALSDLREALLKNDEDRIAETRNKFEEIQDTEEAEVDDRIPITDAAHRQAVEFLHQLGIRQVGALLANQDIPDPLERLVQGIEEIRGLELSEKNQVRDEITEEVGWLLGGIGTDAARSKSREVGQLLDRAHGLTEAKFKQQRPELEKAARRIVGEVPAMEVLGHVVEHTLAELLSNPRLEAALRARASSRP